MEMNDCVLLLTACISPSGMIFTAVQDPQEREAAYIDTIEYYLNNTDCRIVFVNNSGEDISSKIVAKRRVEFLSYFGNNYDRKLGKGYGEFQILKYAFEHSHWLKEASRVVKITGKLKVKNIISLLSVSHLLFGPHRDLVMVAGPSHSDDNQGVIDSRFFIGSPLFYERFLSYKNVIDDSAGFYFEHLLYECVNDNHGCFLVAEFPLPLMIEGYSWTSGNAYGYRECSKTAKLKMLSEYCHDLMMKTDDTGLKCRVLFASLCFRFERLLCIVLSKLGIAFHK